MTREEILKTVSNKANYQEFILLVLLDIRDLLTKLKK